MNSRLLNIFLFTTGAVIGSVVTWKLVKTKYEQIANDEIESVKEIYERKSKKGVQNICYDSLDKVKNELTEELNRVKEYEEQLKTQGYTAYSDVSKKPIEDKKEEVEDMIKPVIITPDEFGDDPDYEVYSLTYYADGVIEDDFGDVIDDPELLVGEGFANHFGEYENDSVFVRNDETQTYYEVLLDVRRYSDLD